MLNRHSNLLVPFESGFIPAFYYRLGEYGNLADKENARRLLTDIAEFPLVKKGMHIRNPEAILARSVDSYASLVDAIFMTIAKAVGKNRWGDKTPSYVTEVDVLWKLFPGCQVIHMVRDGRDVALSNRNLAWGFRSLPRAAQDWRLKTIIGHKVGSVLGEHYLEVRYEDLVQGPEATLRRICEYLGEPYDPGMLTYHESASAEMPEESLAFHQRSISAPDPSLAFAWKRSMSMPDRVIFEQIAGDALDLFGYERERRRGSLSSRLMGLYYATLQRW
jgi:hypothetical protein